ncbi:hypothetical protein TWF173_005501 [Orbilia oligospora]|nr:hypothetical protein TWF173_005501 [Orbilia oligospora]
MPLLVTFGKETKLTLGASMITIDFYVYRHRKNGSPGRGQTGGSTPARNNSQNQNQNQNQQLRSLDNLGPPRVTVYWRAAPPRSLFTGGPIPGTNARQGQERSDYQVIVNTSYPRCHDPHAIVFHSVYGERGAHIEHSELYGTPNPYYAYDCQFVQMLADYAFFRDGVNREDYHPTLTSDNNLVAEGPPFKSIYLENRTGHRMYIQQLQATGDRNEYYVGVAVIPPGTKHRIVKIRNATIQLEYTWESVRTRTTYAALIKCPNEAALSSGRLPDCLLNQTSDRPYGLVISGTEDGGFKFLIHRSGSDYW